MSDKINSLIRSRRFWAVAAGVAAIFAQELGLPITQEQVKDFVMMVAAWVVGESLRSSEKPVS